jgi:rRNA maturation endonuclease Nob1
MKDLLDTLLTIAVLGGILVLSAVLTNLFTRKMYFKCGGCGSLNAKRRSHCRVCGNQLIG